MASSQASAWYHQAYSDLQAAHRGLVKGEASTYCQAIAKQQQVVEKATKAVVESLNHANISRLNIGFSHDIDRYLDALERLSTRVPLSKEVAAFSVYEVGSEGRDLMALAPKRPAPGQPLPRNTEYPFNNADGSWRSPAEEGSFDFAEVVRWSAVAERVLLGAQRIMDAVRRLPRMSGL